MENKIVKTDQQWRSELTAEQYGVTRQRGTEVAFSGEYWAHGERGTYHCVCCDQKLFSWEDKFKSDTGWPSFRRPFDSANVFTRPDRRLESVRTEVLCNRCEAHLGHVFADGPLPGSVRYCINSVALKFTPAEANKPAASESKSAEK